MTHVSVTVLLISPFSLRLRGRPKAARGRGVSLVPLDIPHIGVQALFKRMTHVLPELSSSQFN